MYVRESRSGPERQSPESWFPFTGFLHWGLPSGRAITGKSEFLGKWICAESGRKVCVCVCGRTEVFLSGAQREMEGEAAVSNSPAFPGAQGSECGLQGSRFFIAMSPSLCA